MQKLKISEVRDINRHNRQVIKELNDYMGKDWKLEYKYCIYRVSNLEAREVEIRWMQNDLSQGLYLTNHYAFQRFNLQEIDNCLKLVTARAYLSDSCFKDQFAQFRDHFKKYKSMIDLGDALNSELTEKPKDKTKRTKI